MRALVFAAGLGTRLRPLTNSIPKALVKVDGIPMLERVILRLKDAGYDEVVVNTHYFADKVEDFLSSKDFGVKISISHENAAEPFETGGGIKFARPLLEGGPFLVHNVDIISNADLSALAAAVRPEALATLLVTETEADRYFLFDDDMRLVGWTNVRTGQVRSSLPDFDASRYRKLGFCGIHIVSDAIFPLLESWPDRFSITDFYIEMAATQPIYGVEAKDLTLIDIGSPEKLAEAEHLLANTKNQIR